MKNPSLWAGIIGGLIVVGNVIGGVSVLSNPTDLPRVNLAAGITYLLWIGFGFFLLSVYFKSKKKEDSGQMAQKVEPNTPEDLVRLGKMRNWVIAFVLLYVAINSAQMWILNDYTAGLTLVNIEVIFDLVTNIIFVFLAITLLRGKKNVLDLVLLTMLGVLIVGGVLSYMREGWMLAVAAVPIAFYFIYAIKAPLNRTNFRIAHVFILPAAMICVFALVSIGNADLNKLLETDRLLFEQSSTQNGVTAQAYTIFLQKNKPTASDIQNTKDALTAGDHIAVKILNDVIKEARIKFRKQLPTIPQQKQLYHLDNYETFVNLNREQGKKMTEFMDYAAMLDFDNLSQKQVTDLSTFRNEVDGFSGKIAEAAVKMSNDLR